MTVILWLEKGSPAKVRELEGDKLGERRVSGVAGGRFAPGGKISPALKNLERVKVFSGGSY